MIIPVITLYNPWAAWIMRGWKTIETRTHGRFACLAGKTIGIHAGLYYDRSDLVLKNQYLTDEQMAEYELEANSDIVYPQGVFLGTVKVDSFSVLSHIHSKPALIDCSNTKRFGLFLSNPQPSAYVKVKGSMGIWYYDTEKQIKVEKPGAKIIPLFP